MQSYDGATARIESEATKTLSVIDAVHAAEIDRFTKCFTIQKRGSGSSASLTDNNGTDAKRSALSPADKGYVDSQGGAGWGNKCFTNIKAKNWSAAKAECDMAMSMDPASPQPRASILFNVGLVAKNNGDVDGARKAFTDSLALRENSAVRSALNSLPAQ